MSAARRGPIPHQRSGMILRRLVAESIQIPLAGSLAHVFSACY